MKAALIYARKSQDPKATLRSVTEQEAECRAVCEREGWAVLDVLVDNDRSASRHAKRPREAWERVKKRLVTGEVDVLVTWEASRAQRDLAAYTELRRLCVAHGVRWCYSGTTYDMTDRSDRFRTGLDALTAEDESDRTRERVLRSIRSNAVKGRPHGRRLFGYRREYDAHTGELVGQIPDPDEAPIVAEVVDRLLAGESLRTLALDLNGRGVKTSTGGPWVPSTVRRTAINPAYAALRVHRGEVIGDANWPPIVDTDRHARIVAVLTHPDRRTNRRRERFYLLGGVARCGRCGGVVRIGKDRSGRKVYVCKDHQHLTVGRDALDALVVAVILARLSRPDALDALVDTSPPEEVIAARVEVAELRARLDDAVSRFAAGKLSGPTLVKIEQTIAAGIADAERRARYAGLPTTVASMASSTSTPADFWDGLTIEQKVEVVRALLVVTVLPSRATRTFNPERVVVEWKS